MAAKKKPSLIDIQAELQEDTRPAALVKVEGKAMVVTEEERLAELEQVIDTNLRAFYEVGYALKEIKESQLYKVLSYNTFEDYCVQRWDMHRAHAYRLIDSSNVVANLSPIGDILPERESQVRPLVRLSPDQQREVWQKIVDNMTAHEQAKITAKLVKETVAEVTGQASKPPPKEKTGGQASFHFSEDLDDALNESLYRIKKWVGKDKKSAVSKELIVQAALRRMLDDLESQGEQSVLFVEILGMLNE
jgi:hypothetical protein